VKGSDKVTGSSSFFGIQQEKPLTYIDQTAAWKKFGPITKINLYYSYNHGCVQGVKVGRLPLDKQGSRLAQHVVRADTHNLRD
jgi:hypothetical protein